MPINTDIVFDFLLITTTKRMTFFSILKYPIAENS